MIDIKDGSILEILNNYYGMNKSVYSIEEISNIKDVYISQELSLNTELDDLKYFINLEKLIIKDMFLTNNMLKNICKLKSLKELLFYNCTISNLELLKNLGIRKLVMDSCNYEDLYYLNNIDSLEELYLDNNNLIDLKELIIIIRLKILSLNNTNIINEEQFIYMNNIEFLSISGTNIKDISVLLSMDNLETLVVDKNVSLNNKKVVLRIIDKGVKVINNSNQEVIMYYE